MINQLEIDADDKIKFSIQRLPRNLLPDNIIADIMGVTCLVSLLHIHKNSYRILFRPIIEYPKVDLAIWRLRS